MLGRRGRYNLQGKIVLITGAGSGIGRALALNLARQGSVLILTDINPQTLVETASSCGPAAVMSLKLDVSDKNSIQNAFAAVRERFTSLDVLINNAGVSVGGAFEQVSEANFEWLFSINVFGVVNMCRTFLPLLHKSTDARIVNVSSLFGIVAPAGHVAYVASKFAVRGFSMALAHEFDHKDSTIAVTCVHPGGTATAIAMSARAPDGVSQNEVEAARSAFQKHLVMSPDIAAAIIVRGIEKRQRRIIVGSDAKLMSFIERLLPLRYWSILRFVLSR